MLLILFITIHTIAFFVFLVLCLYVGAFTFRNFISMILAIVGVFWFVFSGTTQNLAIGKLWGKFGQGWDTLVPIEVILGMHFFLTAIPFFALSRFILRVRGFKRDFWYSLFFITAFYPFAILLVVMVVFAISPPYQH